jgi:hypothetical protein
VYFKNTLPSISWFSTSFYSSSKSLHESIVSSMYVLRLAHPNLTDFNTVTLGIQGL